MSPAIISYLLEKFSQRAKNSGFGLLEILAIIMLLGIGIIVGLPYFFAQPNKNGMGLAEGKQTIGALGRTQQAYFIENNKFATSIESLQLGVKTDTNKYYYSMSASKNSVFYYAQPKIETLPIWVGGVFLVNVPETITTASGQTQKTGKMLATTVFISCREEKPKSGLSITDLHPRLENQMAVCPPHSIDALQNTNR